MHAPKACVYYYNWGRDLFYSIRPTCPRAVRTDTTNVPIRNRYQEARTPTFGKSHARQAPGQGAAIGEQTPELSTRLALHRPCTLDIEEAGRRGHEICKTVMVHVDALGRGEDMVEHRVRIVVWVGGRYELIGRVGCTETPRHEL